MVKNAKQIISKVLNTRYGGADFAIFSPPSFDLGDYSTNVAFKLAKSEGGKATEIAQRIKEELIADESMVSVCEEIKTEGGFVNFYLKKEYLGQQLKKIIEEGDKYGNSNLGKGKKINLEFISANPTGPMTVHNVRAGSFGDCLGNIFNKVGYECTKEYYINDVGVQVNRLGKSVLRRWQELSGQEIDFEEGLYKGDYVLKVAEKIKDEELPEGEEAQIIFCRDFAVEEMIKSAQASVTSVGINFDVWFRESQLHQVGLVDKVLDYLEDKNLIYEKDEAKWFKVSNYFSEQQDAVVVKNDGQISYLMNDIAYTKNKIEERGFGKAINIWGTDHHGDVPRLLAGAKALGYEDGKLEILLHQLVLVKEKDEYQRMSKREGKFILLDDFLPKVGKDALRFFFLSKDLNTHMEFDVDLAREQSNKNPVYYAQYASARSHSLFEKAGLKSEETEYKAGANYDEEEWNLVRKMIKLPELIEDIAEDYKVHHLAEYILDLANSFHKFYETHRIIEEEGTNQARITLVAAFIIVINICFGLMGITAPKKM